MAIFLTIWAISSFLSLTIIFGVKSWRRRRLAKASDFHWPGLIVIALIIGAMPAFIYDNQSPRSVLVPDGVAERPNINTRLK